MESIVLVPYPKKLSLKKEKFFLQNGDMISIPVEEKEELFSVAKKVKEEFKKQVNLNLEIMVGEHGSFRKALTFTKEEKLVDQAYTLNITPEGIHIGYKKPVGAFYGVKTLKQLLKQYGKSLPCLEISDEPDYEARGIMHDISRNKIPTMDTLFNLVDFMADLKLNQLQLYIEGIPFAYKSYPGVWKARTPFTGEDMLELDKYCRENYIELVPNQNSFGHMAGWLTEKDFNHLAECPDGFEMWDLKMPPGTLDPQDAGSLELVKNQYDDLLPYFSSDLFNIGCDETYELGQGKSKELCEEKGTGRVYLDYLMKIYEAVKQRGKTMMFWGDIINKYPELIPELPTDSIALEWGYEAAHPFDERAKRFKESKIPFYVCPGTSSWNAITGRTDNMKANLLNAAENGKKHGAIGYLNTDWGDYGHWQYLPVSYAGFAYGAAVNWSAEDNKDIDLAAYLDQFVFEDTNGVMGQFVLEVGNYYQKEGKVTFNTTNIARILYKDLEDMKPMEELCEENLIEVKDYVTELAKKLDEPQMNCKDAELIVAEYRNAIKFVQHGADLGVLKLKLDKGIKDETVKVLLEEMIDDISIIIYNHKKLWLERNRLSELHESVKHLESLKKQYEEYYQNNFS